MLKLTNQKKQNEQPNTWTISGAVGSPWVPDMNIYDTGKSYELCLAVSALTNVKIDIVGDNIIVSGDVIHPEPKVKKGQSLKILEMEIDHGRFSKKINLPEDANLDKNSQRYEDGILWISFNKHTVKARKTLKKAA